MNKILITGSTGFIGRALLTELRREGNYEIIEFTRLKNDDILDYESISKFFNTGLSHVIHLAGETVVPKSWEDPSKFIQTNVSGTTNVLEICRHNNCSMTNISAYVYGNPETLPITVDSKVKPNNPYALSKYLGEQVCQFYSECYEVPVTSLRLFNVYGVGQSNNFLIQSIIEQTMDNDICEITVNNLATKRDYVFLEDVVSAILCSMQEVNIGFHNFNIASGKSFSVKEVIAVIQEICQTNRPVLSRNQSRVNEIVDTQADISHSIEILKWKPSNTFRQGIQKIIDALSDNVK